MRERKWGKKLHMFLSLHTSVRVCSWFIKACCSPFYFPLEKWTISIQLHLLGEQNQKEPRFWWSGGFLLFCGVFFATGNTKYRKEGDVTKPILSYSNSVHLVSGITLTYCRWSIHLSLPPLLFLSGSREVESKHWRESNIQGQRNSSGRQLCGMRMHQYLTVQRLRARKGKRRQRTLQ